MDLFVANIWPSITPLIYGFGFAILLGALFGFVCKTLFDWTVRGLPRAIGNRR